MSLGKASSDPSPSNAKGQGVALRDPGATRRLMLGRLAIPSRDGERYAIGHVVEEGRHLFVSSGLGTSILPVRFRVVPEISLVTLRSAEARARWVPSGENDDGRTRGRGARSTLCGTLNGMLQRWRTREPMSMMRKTTQLYGALAVALCIATTAGARGADGRFEERESSHFVLHQDVDIDRRSGVHGSRAFEQKVLAILEDAYDQIDARLGLRPARKIQVTIYDAADFDRRFAGLFRFPAAGFYGSSIHIRGRTAIDGNLVRTLAHEVVHAAFHAESPSLVLPAWLNEGVAEWYEARHVGKRRLSTGEYQALVHLEGQALFSIAQLSVPSFQRFGPQGARIAYLQSYGFIDHLVRRHGEHALRSLCRELMRTGDLRRAVKKTFRSDLAELDAAFHEELASAR